MKAANSKSYPSCRTCIWTVNSTGQVWQLGSGTPVVIATHGMAICPQSALAAEAAPRHLEQNISHVKHPQGHPEIPGGLFSVEVVTQAAERLRGL